MTCAKALIVNKPGWLHDVLDLIEIEPGQHIPVWLDNSTRLTKGSVYASAKTAQSIATRQADTRNSYVVTCYSNGTKVLTSGNVVLATRWV